MDVYARVIKLKPNSHEKVSAWANAMNERKSEALQSIRAEGVEIESWFSLTLEEEDYLIVYMRASSMQQAQDAAAESEFSIDKIHQQFKADTWVRGAGGVGELLLDLSNRKNGAASD